MQRAYVEKSSPFVNRNLSGLLRRDVAGTKLPIVGGDVVGKRVSVFPHDGVASFDLKEHRQKPHSYHQDAMLMRLDLAMCQDHCSAERD